MPARAGRPFSVWAYPWALVFLSYSAGTAVFLGLVTVGRIRVGRWVRTGRAVIDSRILDAFRDARQNLGLKRDFTVVESTSRF